jgi:hypothetical protein
MPVSYLISLGAISSLLSFNIPPLNETAARPGVRRTELEAIAKRLHFGNEGLGVEPRRAFSTCVTAAKAPAVPAAATAAALVPNSADASAWRLLPRPAVGRRNTQLANQASPALLPFTYKQTKERTLPLRCRQTHSRSPKTNPKRGHRSPLRSGRDRCQAGHVQIQPFAINILMNLSQRPSPQAISYQSPAQPRASFAG